MLKNDPLSIEYRIVLNSKYRSLPRSFLIELCHHSWKLKKLYHIVLLIPLWIFFDIESIFMRFLNCLLLEGISLLGRYWCLTPNYNAQICLVQHIDILCYRALILFIEHYYWLFKPWGSQHHYKSKWVDRYFP